jgi:alpha-tubulin suppressor-like RCC1 family protein
MPGRTDVHALISTQGVRIMFVAGGSAAVHCLAGDADGNLYSWGRNEVGARLSLAGLCVRM